MTEPHPKRLRSNPKDEANNFHGTFTDDSPSVTNLQDDTTLPESSTTITSGSGSDMTSYDQQRFPNEILTLILQHLPKQYRHQTTYQFSFVSKQFNTISNSFIWKEVRLNNNRSSELFLNGVSDASPERLSILLQHMTDFRFRGSCWTNDQWTRLLPHLGNLNYLSICTLGITDLGFQKVPHYCPELTSLELEKTALTEVSFILIGQQCTQLSRFKWRIGENQFIEWLGALIPGCPITHLKLTTRHRLMTDTIAILHQLHHLRSLEMETASGYEAFIQAGKTQLLTPPPPPQPSHFWPHLTTLILDRTADVEDHTFIPFIITHPHITYLRFEYAHKLTSAALDTLNLRLPRLKSLTMCNNQHFTLERVESFIRQARHLEYASFRNCWNVSKKRFTWIKGRVKIG